MQVKEIMTENPVCCTPDTNLQDVAKLMLEHDCGLIPVVNNQENKKPVGTITDRDIAIRTFAAGQNPLEIKASNIMTMGVTTVKPETSVQECCDVMENKKIRRVLVVDNSGGVCGIVAQADVAEYGHPELIGNMVEEISESEASPNSRRYTNSRNNQSYSNQRYSNDYSNEYANQKASYRMPPPPPPPLYRMENAPQYRTERYSGSNDKSSFNFNSLLPLLIGIGAGVALKYYYMPEKESKSGSVVARRDLTASIQEARDAISKKPLDLSKPAETHPAETREVITGRVTTSTPADIQKLGGKSAQSNISSTGLNSTREDKSDTDPKFGRSTT
ncbi:MAG: CBS domain-containing protein [Pyrinomonadaceae bacterium]|jgi:CBS domain-containing protein